MPTRVFRDFTHITLFPGQIVLRARFTDVAGSAKKPCEFFIDANDLSGLVQADTPEEKALRKQAEEAGISLKEIQRAISAYPAPDVPRVN